MTNKITTLYNAAGGLLVASLLTNCAPSDFAAYPNPQNQHPRQYNPWMPEGSRAAARHRSRWGDPEPERYKTPAERAQEKRISEAVFLGGMGLMFGGDSSGSYTPSPNREIPDYTPPPAPAPDPWGD